MNDLVRPALLLALLLPLAASVGVAQDASADEWVITGTETCNEERRVVTRDVRVQAGGVLDLQGCILAMDSPPYNDTYFASRDEGLTLRVDRGGLLRMHALPGRPAGVERANETYGYTIKAFGDVESIGLPGTPNRIAGLEGAHEGQLALGGFQVRANATVRHTRFEGNYGPGLFLLPGSRLVGERIDFVSYGGLMVSGATEVRLSDWTATALNSPVSLSRTQATFTDCRLDGGLLGLFVAQSNLTMTDCTVASAKGSGISIQDANVTLDGVDVTYGKVGVGLQQRKTLPGQGNRIGATDSSILGQGPNATSAILAHQGIVEVRQSHLSSVSEAVVNATLVHLTVSGGRMEGPQAIDVTDPYSIDVRGVQGPAPVVTVHRNTVVKVTDSAGKGLSGVSLRLEGAEATTGADGTGVLRWTFLEASEATALDYAGTRKLTLHDPETGSDVERDVKADTAYLEVTLARGSAWWPPSPVVLGVAAALVLAAVALFVWGKRKAKAGP